MPRSDDDPRDRIKTLRNLLEKGERGGSAADCEALLELSDNLDLIPSEIGDYRHRDILRRCCMMSEAMDSVDLVDVIESKDAAEEVVRWINREYNNEHTNQDYRKDLRAFATRYLKRSPKHDGPPESVAWVPTGTSNDFDPVPSERDLIRFEEAEAMAENCKNNRDAALIMIQFEAGLRGGELYDLEVGDIFDSDHSTGLHVDGKEGERSVHLIVGTPYLQQWLADHPERSDSEAPLWSKFDTVERASYPTFGRYFKRAAARVDVDKNVTPTIFRKSNTRWLCRLGFSQPEIEDRQGRERGSDHTARYMARFGEGSLEDSYAQLHGKEVESDEPDEFAPVVCGRCGRETPRTKDFCVWCDFARSYDAVDSVEGVNERHVESAAEATGEEAAKVVEADRIRSPAMTRIMADRED